MKALLIKLLLIDLLIICSCKAIMQDDYFDLLKKVLLTESIGKINIVPHIGMVILNFFNNSFYAVNEKLILNRLPLTDNYKPTVSIHTKKINDTIEIKVSDNGNDIA